MPATGVCRESRENQMNGEQPPSALAIAASDAHPDREEHGPGMWLLLKGKDAFEIQLAPNRDNKTYVADRRLLQENPGG